MTKTRATLGSTAAGLLVFGSSGAVLVVELVALRLLAPFLGLTLETNTLVIGIALAAIAAGSWAGGRAADVVDPARTLAPLLAISGAVVAVTPPLVRGAGSGEDDTFLMFVATATIVVPGALLSAVTPMVTKLRLRTLEETGTVVGRLSGIGTAGAIAGTVLTGFVLITRISVSTIMVGLGVLLVASAVVVAVGLRRAGVAVTTNGLIAAGALVAGGGVLAVADPGGCDVETTYHCASVVADPEREGGRTLVLDGVRHSYVDLDDPTHLEFSYVRALAAVVDTSYPEGEALRAYHLGGGGLTFPRYLDVVRPGTTSVVSEIDQQVIDLDVERLGVELDDDLQVRVEDARLGLAAQDDASRDLVVGDAFGGVSVPFHLTTREALTEVRRVLDDDGLYVANLIDHGDLSFARAEVATLRTVFDHVALMTNPLAITGQGGGNLVAVGADRPLDLDAIAQALAGRDLDWQVIDGEELDRWVGDGLVLTDDHAPVDQLLTPYGT